MKRRRLIVPTLAAVVAVAVAVAILLSVGFPLLAPPVDREVHVRLTRFAFDPSTIEVTGGERVRFVVTADIFHTFTVLGFEDVIDIHVETGQTVRVDITIPDEPGSYFLYCRPHVGLDMIGEFVIL